jgi:hypothetical protein
VHVTAAPAKPVIFGAQLSWPEQIARHREIGNAVRIETVEEIRGQDIRMEGDSVQRTSSHSFEARLQSGVPFSSTPRNKAA